MSRIFYPLRYRLDHKERFLIWYTSEIDAEDEGDGVVVDKNGFVPVFRTQERLSAYAQARGLASVKAEASACHNLDSVASWLRRKRPAQLNCVEFLAAWNLLADISATIGGDFDPDKAATRNIYCKVFWGNNLPAVTPEGKHYVPIWPCRESRIIRDVLKSGLAMFRRTVTKT